MWFGDFSSGHCIKTPKFSRNEPSVFGSFQISCFSLRNPVSRLSVIDTNWAAAFPTQIPRASRGQKFCLFVLYFILRSSQHFWCPVRVHKYLHMFWLIMPLMPASPPYPLTVAVDRDDFIPDPRSARSLLWLWDFGRNHRDVKLDGWL